MDNFYTYIYLDPRKPGVYQYGNYKFDYEPFYVGKGKDKQSINHLLEAEKKNLNQVTNKHKYSKIKNILKEKLYPLIFIVNGGLYEQEAFNLEIWLIWAIGRSDLGVGPLTNLTDGGEGQSGFKISEEVKLFLHNLNKGKKPWNTGLKLSVETKRKIGGSHKGKHLSIEHRKKLSGKIPWNKGLKNIYTQDTKDKMRNAKQGKVSKNKGKTWEQIHGIEKALFLKNEMSKKYIGRTVWNKGLKYTNKQKEIKEEVV